MYPPDFTDRLISSTVMGGITPEERGKSNETYKNSSKSINDVPMSRPSTWRNNSIPNGNTVTTRNNTVPFDRLSSTVSSQYTTANRGSQLALYEQSEIKTKVFNCRFKTAFVVLLIVSLAVIATLATLYVMKVNENSTSSSQVSMKSSRTKIKERIPCFHRVEAQKINDLKNQSEIKEAIENSTKEIFQAFHNKQNGYHAFSLSVNYMGERVWKMDYGLMDFRDNSSNFPNQDTMYPIASITKVFTVLMLEMLVADGTIKSIDDEITAYEKFLNIENPFNDDQVTFRQLACMMSGIQRESPCYPYQEDNYCPYNNQEMFRRINNTVLVLPPDQAPSYSNLGISILGRILEKQLKNNQTYEDWVVQNILKPLNMTNTGFDVLNKSSEFPVSTPKEGVLAKVIDWGWNAPCGGMYSTASDLGKLGQLFTTDVGSKSILSEKLIKRLLKPEYVWSDGNAQGCPFEISKKDPTDARNGQIGYMSYTKSGTIFGYNSKFSIVPEMKLNINVLSARTEGYQGNIMNIVSNMFVKAFDKLLRRKEKQYILPANYEFYTGSYRQNTSWPLITNPCNVLYKDGKLMLHLEWMKVPLMHDRENILKAVSYFQEGSCTMLSDGVFREKYYFDRPQPGSDKLQNKSSGFHINGISSYGYVRFDRIYD